MEFRKKYDAYTLFSTFFRIDFPIGIIWTFCNHLSRPFVHLCIASFKRRDEIIKVAFKKITPIM